jgi:hypothetical protein
MSDPKNDEQWRQHEMMPDEADLNTVLDDINGISACIFEARQDFRALYPPTPAEDEVRAQNPQADVLNRLNEAMMLVDDAMAIIVDEIGGEFENEA